VMVWLSYQKTNFWHHIVQTNTLLDSQTTNTHPTITRTIIRVINQGHPQVVRSHYLNHYCDPPHQTIVCAGHTR
ncbi:hypothetical protein, partial [Brevibacterium sp. 2SA]|uniref:hypothetical protein n=1 Tax=Brevibacterium sp. 2SA TaxID=2502198 RepID=UPI001BB22C76